MTDSQNLVQFPDLSGSPNLKTLILSGCIRLEEVHQSVGTLNKISILVAEGCEKLERLPTMFQSESLAHLNFSGCRSLRKFPEIQPYFRELGVTSSLPDNIPRVVDLTGCSNIETLPNSLCRLKKLILYLNHCTKLKNLPEDIYDHVNLEGIDASETSIWCIPNSITRLENLKCLSFRKVPKLFYVSDFCSWGCFAQLDLNFHLPNVLSAFCALIYLDLSACNLLVVPEDLGCLASLVQLNLGRNSFSYLPKSFALLCRLQLLDLTYCEKLKELPELPPGIMALFADDRFALQSIPTLSTTYKELYVVSFANQKLQEMWCNSLRGSSSVQMRNCPGINMSNMLEDILLPFLSLVQRKLVFDDPRRGGRFSIVFPRCYPSVEVPSWFDYRQTGSNGIFLELDKHWYNDKFLGFVIYCQLPFLDDGLFQNLTQRDSASSSSWSLPITTKLGPETRPVFLKKVVFEVSNLVVCASQDCFVFLQFDFDLDLREGEDASMIDDPNISWRFQASFDKDISSNWGVRLVYADDIEAMRLKSSFTDSSICAKRKRKELL